MIRTTISMHEHVFKRVKDIAHRTGRSLGETISELLSIGLQTRAGQNRQKRNPLILKTYPMGTPRVSLEDKNAIADLIHKGML